MKAHKVYSVSWIETREFEVTTTILAQNEKDAKRQIKDQDYDVLITLDEMQLPEFKIKKVKVLGEVKWQF